MGKQEKLQEKMQKRQKKLQKQQKKLQKQREKTRAKRYKKINNGLDICLIVFCFLVYLINSMLEHAGKEKNAGNPAR